ncbi:MAG: formylglycine-generating enzyme family protein [Planctomycetota bacterium]|nr:formylglycine-generating enzyme family protein [Planctomycetota bacterium]
MRDFWMIRRRVDGSFGCRLQGAGRRFLLLAALVLLTCAADGSSAESHAAHPGLVKEKPATGRAIETEHGYMVPYKRTIPGTKVSFEMVPVPAGIFLMGSPKDEKGRRDDEGPQVRVRVEPFWLAKCEVSWAEYHEFMNLYAPLKQIQGLRNLLADDVPLDFTGKKPEQIEAMKKAAARRIANRATLQARLKDSGKALLRGHLERLPADVDAITAPTELYEPDTTYEYGGAPEQPAVSMTQYAAKQYSKWLSRITGTFYRLPSEAEWEYACRAGTTTAFHFGDDPALIAEYAWYKKNADFELHAVGTKKPNAWGLHDMHGSVAEWVLDGYDEAGYSVDGDPTTTATDAIHWTDKEYPRTVRGGSLENNASDCRSAARMASNDEEWKDDDPNLPKSPWWFTSDPARGVGFRLIEPLAAPRNDLLAKFWEIDSKSVGFDVSDRLREGRGIRDNAHVDLPAVIQQLKEIGIEDK